MHKLVRARLRAADVRGERGFVMVTIMGVLLVGSLFAVAALAAANQDIRPSRADIDRKNAFAAAEAGLNYYLYRLNEDGNVWTDCDQLSGPSATEDAPVNQPWDGTGDDNRVWRNVEGAGDGSYTVELLPASGTTCDPADPVGSMINPANGTFRIRATGRSSPSATGPAQYRSIVATFRRRGFLDFLYFTDFETSPPSYYARYGAEAQAWASEACARWWRSGRSSQRFELSGDDGSTTIRCTEIQFAPGDAINGPMHTNDNILVCGNPTFGRLTDSAGNAVTDAVEVMDPNAPGYRNACTGSPVVRPSGNSLRVGAQEMGLPPSNGALAAIVQPQYSFTGTTTIRLLGNRMQVSDYGGGGGARRDQTLDFPENGVVSVQDGACGSGSYNALDPYTLPTQCAVAYVSGTYSESLTITSERDIVVRPLPGDSDNSGVVRSGDALLGLIGTDHVRVFHQVNRSSSGTTCTEIPSSGTKENITIDAAILALNYSFIVDNYDCGEPLGRLTVNGAIAQRFRGPVGRGGASGNSSGYIKNYSYDDRLQYRSPPFFLDPVQSAWQVVRHSEQVPAAKP